jgi:diguanylate cyclase (GGDEF)-like protein
MIRLLLARPYRVDALSQGLLDAMDGAVALVDPGGCIRAVNAAWTQYSVQNSAVPGMAAPGTGVGSNYLAVLRAATATTGGAPEEPSLRGIRAVMSGAQTRFSMEYACHSPSRQAWRHLQVTPLAAQPGWVVIQHRDITRQQEADSRIDLLSHFDPLTRLPNRRRLYDNLGKSLDDSARTRRHGALLCLDLDQFKNINDTLGHEVGDRLLVEVARRIQLALREGDTAARVGGDGFAIIVNGLSAHAAEAVAVAGAIAERVAEIIAKPLDSGEREFHCTASIGAALFLGGDDTADAVIKNADLAMHQAKSAGTNALRFFDPAARTALLQQISLAADLRKAVERAELQLHYQPQVLASGALCGAEALLRWNHPLRGSVSPAEFIPIAEENGLILPIGQWVLETACAQLKIWESSPLTGHLRLAVNVSARQFRQADFVDQVRSVLARTGARPSRLKMELTESMVLDNVGETLQKMQILKALGVGFSLDDFGTGNSCLSYLTRLPLEQIKIDRSFVRNLPESRSDSVIAQTIIAMANGLGLDVIAEGVETTGQRAFLEANGCLSFQGYLFGKPLGLEEFEAFIVRSSGRDRVAMPEKQC